MVVRLSALRTDRILPPGNTPGGHSAIGRILCQWKIPKTPTGIEPATFRFVAQHLSHCATAVPHCGREHGEIQYGNIFTEKLQRVNSIEIYRMNKRHFKHGWHYCGATDLLRVPQFQWAYFHKCEHYTIYTQCPSFACRSHRFSDYDKHGLWVT